MTDFAADSQAHLSIVVGARPQIIKAAPICRALEEQRFFDYSLVHTGQHYDFNMSEVNFQELGIKPPARFLGAGSGSHGAQTAKMLQALEEVFIETQPAMVVVLGDTNSTIAGAIAASKLGIPIAHVEAGLRSFDRSMPEEVNRIITDHVSEILFAPTSTAMENLANEGLSFGPSHRTCLQVGDVMYDSMLLYASVAKNARSIFGKIGVSPKKYLLLTIHRASATDTSATLSRIVKALSEVARHCSVVFPIHPRTRKMMELQGIELPRELHCIEPVSYLEMIALEREARLVVTDSGGVQKEAFFFGVPSVILRKETEWIEIIQCGAARLADPATAPIAEVIQRALDDTIACVPPAQFFGDGRASIKIADTLREYALKAHR